MQRFLKSEEARAIYGVSKATFYRDVKAKRIPTVRVGRALLVPASFFDNLEAQAFGKEA